VAVAAASAARARAATVDGCGRGQTSRPRVERVAGGVGGGRGGGARVKMVLRGAKVEIHAEHYDKLHRLFVLNAGPREDRRTDAMGTATGTGMDLVPGSIDVDLDAFESAAFAMLARYTAAQGGMHRAAGGHHTALHGAVFDALHNGMGLGFRVWGLRFRVYGLRFRV